MKGSNQLILRFVVIAVSSSIHCQFAVILGSDKVIEVDKGWTEPEKKWTGPVTRGMGANDDDFFI
jgi:hypothetical protein